MKKSFILSLLLLLGSCGSDEPTPEPDKPDKPEKKQPDPEPDPQPADDGLIRKDDLKKLGFPDDATINKMPPGPDREEASVFAPDHAVRMLVRVLTFESEAAVVAGIKDQRLADKKQFQDAKVTIEDVSDDHYVIMTEAPGPNEGVLLRQVYEYERVGKKLVVVGAASSGDQEMPHDDLRKIVESAMELVKPRL